jgi:predicted permease
MNLIGRALRSFRATPGLVALTVLVLALGIGANVAIFSVVNEALVRPLPYRDPERLAMIWERIPELSEENMSATAPDYFDYRAQSRAFESIAAFEPREVNLAFGAQAERVSGVRVTEPLFPLLGVEPVLGRGFSKEEDVQGGPRAAILDHAYWQGRFGGDRSVLGKSILVDHVPHTVVGIMPRGFDFPPSMTRGFRPADVFLPMAFSPEELETRGDSFDTSLIGRLRAGVSLQAASADADRVARLIYDAHFQSSRGRFTLRGASTSLREEVVGGIRPALWILQGAVSLLLLIGCANAASLLLARAAGRRREIGIRNALGAGRAGLLRMLLGESLIMSLLAGVLGVLLALWAVDALLAAVPESLEHVDASVLDPRTLAFALVVSMATGLAFGIAPAIVASRTTLADEVKPAGLRRRGPGGTLVVAEVAMALVLLSSAALLLRSFQEVMKVNPGFEPEGGVAFSISLADTRYPPAEARRFFETLLDRLQSVSGVTSVAAGTNIPLDDEGRILISLEGREEEAWGRNLCWPSFIEGEYFQSLGIPLVSGRYFGPEDGEQAPPVVIVNEALARKYWPGEDALGRRFKWGSPTSTAPYMEIVGVVSDSVQGKLNEPPIPAVYVPLRQLADRASGLRRRMTVVARAEADIEAIAPLLRREVQALDPEVPLFGLRTLRDALAASESDRRFLAFLVALFALTAALLAAAGLVGVIGRTVTLSKREIGIRMALGARASTVVGCIVLGGMKLALAGLILGLAVSLLLTKTLSSQLYAVSPRDPAVLSGVAAFVVLLAAAAAYLPARRAARVDPIESLRMD